MKKYELTTGTKVINGVELHRIKALKSFGNVEKGELGGWVESEKNLSQYGNAWVGEDAMVSDNATVCGNAIVYGNAKVGGNAWVFGNAKVFGNADYIVFKNWWSSGRYFTWTRSNNKWKVGCFYGSGEELIAKAYKDSEKSGREYERVVKYVESILQEEENNK
jgi:hypothetical protein